MAKSDAEAVGVSQGQVGFKEFDSPSLFRVATDRQMRPMNRQPQTHVSSTVNRDADGSIRYIVVRAEYFLEDLDAHENADDKYTEGVNAKFRFDVYESDEETTAEIVSVKDIEDSPSHGYETSFGFLRALPVAEDAALNIPGVDEVASTEGYIQSLLDQGRNAV